MDRKQRYHLSLPAVQWTAKMYLWCRRHSIIFPIEEGRPSILEFVSNFFELMSIIYIHDEDSMTPHVSAAASIVEGAPSLPDFFFSGNKAWRLLKFSAKPSMKSQLQSRAVFQSCMRSRRPRNFLM